jgi:hypothetical protein
VGEGDPVAADGAALDGATGAVLTGGALLAVGPAGVGAGVPVMNAASRRIIGAVAPHTTG